MRIFAMRLAMGRLYALRSLVATRWGPGGEPNARALQRDPTLLRELRRLRALARKMGRMAHDSTAPILETPPRKWGRGAALGWGRAANPEPAATPGRRLGPTL
jgi:hypothetical protein